MGFVKATKTKAKGRVAFVGVSGSGKTWTALMWARVLAGPGGRIALIDTENHSASKYADTYDFDTLDLSSFTPKAYIAAIKAAEDAGYDVLVIDSLSHAWAGKDGVLALVDQATSRSRSGNAFTTGWREVTPEHNLLVDALLRCKCHLIVTMRAKTEYVIEDFGNGKKAPRKVGMAPVQRDGMEYEFDLVADMDDSHTLKVSKSRCRTLDKLVKTEPGPNVAEKFRDWLMDGAAPALEVITEAGEVHIHEPAAPEPFTDDVLFSADLDEMFKQRGFSPEAADIVIKNVLAKKGAKTLKNLPPAVRRAFYESVKRGDMDKFKIQKAEELATAGK